MTKVGAGDKERAYVLRQNCVLKFMLSIICAFSVLSTVLVYTRIAETNGDVVELNYRLRSVDGSWKIIDIYLNGTVSELALRRSEYSTLIKRDGFEALLTALEDKIAKLAAGEVSS